MKALEEIELDSESIAYRGEGNATLVIALKDKGKVLRFQKYPNNQPIAYRNAIKADLQRHQWFARNVLRRLICKEMFDEPLLVMVSQKNMELINDLWNRCRPGYRICKVIPDQDSWALLLNDYCCLPISPSLPTDYAVGPVITVEIKPKQGFPPMINPNICRFSLKQALKLGSFRSREESCYCPLDIFSGCQTRMEVAMKNLIRTPQNNFRVFRDSKLMYSDQNTKNLEAVLSGFLDENFNEDERSEQVLISLIIDSLLLPFGEPTSSMIHAHSNEKQSYCSYHRHFSCDYDCTGNHKLHPECVLATVLRLQMLDTIGSQGALDIFNTLQCLSPDLISRLEGFGESPQDEALFPFESLGSPARLARESEVDFCMRKLLEYLISLIAKDCSIMISMQRIENPCHNGSTVRGNHQFMMPQKTRINKMKKAISRIYPNDCGNNNNHHYHLRNNSSENSSPRIRIIRDKINKSWYAVSIAITDLDFKKSSKIVQVYKREVKMIEAFNNRLAAGIT